MVGKEISPFSISKVIQTPEISDFLSNLTFYFPIVTT
jgi:hypothetical protein